MTNWIQTVCGIIQAICAVLPFINKDLKEQNSISKKKLELDEKRRREEIMPWMEFDANFKHQGLQRDNLTSFIFFNKIGKGEVVPFFKPKSKSR